MRSRQTKRAGLAPGAARPVRPVGVLVSSAVVLAGVLLLEGCEAKLAEVFAPAQADGGGPGTVPTADEVSGLWTVHYTTVSTTCEANLPPFDVDATISTVSNGTVTLDVLFSDAPVPITGAYDLDTGNFAGETGLVPIGGGLDANEIWQAQFAFAGADVVFGGSSHVPVTDGGSPVCERMFTVAGIKQ